MAVTKYFKFVALMCFVGVSALCQNALSLRLAAVTRAEAEKDPLACAQYLASKLPSTAESDLFSDLSLRASHLGFGEKSLRLVGRSAARPSERSDDYYEKLRMIKYAGTDASVDTTVATLSLIPEGEIKDRRLLNIVQTAVDAKLISKAATIISLIQSPYCRAKALLILGYSLDSARHPFGLADYVDTAFKIALSNEYRSDAVTLLPEIANRYLDLGETEKALQTLRQSEEAADRADSNSVLSLLSEIAETFLRIGRTGEVLRLADRMMQLPSSDVSLEMLSQKCGGKNYCELGEHVANGIRDPMTSAMTLVNISYCYSSNGLSFRSAQLLSASAALAASITDAGSQVDLLTMVAETYCAIDGKKQALAVLLIAEHIAAKIKDNFEENGLFACREEYRGKVAEAYLHCGYPAEAARVFDSMTDAYLINQIIDGVSSSLDLSRPRECESFRSCIRHRVHSVVLRIVHEHGPVGLAGLNEGYLLAA